MRDAAGRRVRTVDMHAHVVTPTVERLVADCPQKKAEPDLRLRTMGAASVAHNNAVMLPQAAAALTDLAVRLADMDHLGVDMQVISPLPTQYYYWAGRDLAEQIVGLQNEHIAALCAQHPEMCIRDRILTASGRATGVRLADGEEITANDAVIGCLLYTSRCV